MIDSVLPLHNLNALKDLSVQALWQKILNLLSHEKAESVLAALLTQFRTSKAKSSGFLTIKKDSELLSALVGQSSVENNPQLLYLFRHKFLVDRVYGDDVLKVLIHWYSTFPKTSELCVHGVLEQLIEVWTDINFIQHSTWEQMQYVTHGILVCLSYTTKEDLSEKHLTSRFISGMGKYLDSTVTRVRRLAMVTAECFSKISDGSEVLSFELEEDDASRALRKLAEPMTEEEGEEHVEEDAVVASQKEDEAKVEFAKVQDSGNTVRKSMHISNDDADSDDEDLEPYDMSEDASETAESGGKRLKPPRYIRDCMQWLRSEEDPDKLELALQSVEGVIRSTSPRELAEISKDLCWTLLNLQNNYDLDGFVKNRMGAMVAVVVQIPLQASRHAIDAFFEKNYSLGQRLDVLTCLATAAMELSALKDEPDPPAMSAISRSRTNPPSATDIIAERIKAKTRRFSRKSLVPVKKAQANRFSDVAGAFLFPLLGGFQKAG
ncbi:TEL2, telomere maintenance protein 2 [Rhizophlyctis rosea]|nr:TEL2, telomere maintenance protein 2 [Rhizophlyctis rosea]